MRTLVKEGFGQPDRVNTMFAALHTTSFKIYLQWRKDDNINLQVFHVTIFFLTSKNCVGNINLEAHLTRFSFSLGLKNTLRSKVTSIAFVQVR
ncbi:hypothetical protein HanPSC8_Chr11g0485901 [Helianthus annuus]|nr:hypothetical protein HanPSC8_Chr11g0485901 [Helianthus annuus]